jgi:excinuclease ABC subunit A
MFVAYETDEKSVTKYGELAYSRQLMCEDTGISYEEPSPNSFSFNSPYGACPTCKGLGTVYTVDMKAIIPDENLSINDGGIAPLGGEREAYIFRQVQTLSKKHKFSLDKPIKDLPKKTMIFCFMAMKKQRKKNCSLMKKR